MYGWLKADDDTSAKRIGAMCALKCFAGMMREDAEVVKVKKKKKKTNGRKMRGVDLRGMGKEE